MVKVKAYAKVNLMLDILRKRCDNYHELFMVMQSVGVYDTVSVEKRKDRKITITANTDDIPLDSSNIAWKAAEAFFKYTKIKNPGIHIDLQKRIPHAAGLAGGSADGAGVLVALNEIFGAELTEEELCEIGVKIGADVPFCIKGGTLLAQGIGEILHKLKPLPKCFILLAKPEFGVNTGKAYGLFDTMGKTHNPDPLGMLCAVQSRDLKTISESMENVFEQFVEVPGRIEMKEIMRECGALGVCMSGSGPTVFGIFENKEQAQEAAEKIKPYAKDIIVTTPVSKGCKIVK